MRARRRQWGCCRQFDHLAMGKRVTRRAVRTKQRTRADWQFILIQAQERPDARYNQRIGFTGPARYQRVIVMPPAESAPARRCNEVIDVAGRNAGIHAALAVDRGFSPTLANDSNKHYHSSLSARNSTRRYMASMQMSGRGGFRKSGCPVSVMVPRSARVPLAEADTAGLPVVSEVVSPGKRRAARAASSRAESGSVLAKRTDRIFSHHVMTRSAMTDTDKTRRIQARRSHTKPREGACIV
jgi:hypothetical protein